MDCQAGKPASFRVRIWSFTPKTTILFGMPSATSTSSRHAFLVLCHKQPRQINALTRLLAEPEQSADRTHVFLHLDVKFAPLLPQILPRPNLMAFSRHRMHWGGFGLVRATLDLLRRALEVAPFDYLHLISGQCLPLRPIPEILDHFDASGLEHMASTPFPVEGLPYQGLDRILVDYPPHLQGRYRGVKARMLEEYKLEVLRDASRHRKLDHLPRLYHGSQWFSVTGACAEQMLRFSDHHPELARFCETSLIPDEMFFQTVLMASPFADQLDRRTFRHMDWKRGGPYTFTREDVTYLLASPGMFARKFDIGKDEAAVARLLRAVRLRAAQPEMPASDLLEAVNGLDVLDEEC